MAHVTITIQLTDELEEAGVLEEIEALLDDNHCNFTFEVHPAHHIVCGNPECDCAIGTGFCHCQEAGLVCPGWPEEEI